MSEYISVLKREIARESVCGKRTEQRDKCLGVKQKLLLDLVLN